MVYLIFYLKCGRALELACSDVPIVPKERVRYLRGDGLDQTISGKVIAEKLLNKSNSR